MSMDESKPIREMAICLVVEPTPLKNITVVSWDHDIPNCFWKVIKFMFQSTNQMSYVVIGPGNVVQFRMNQQPLWGGWGSHPLTNSLGQHSTGDGILKNQILVDPPRGSVRENRDHLQEILVRQVGR